MDTTTNQKELYIRLKDGEKESELRLTEIAEEHKLPLIDGFFKFFNINVDFKEMAETYVAVGASYRDFYKNAKSVEFAETNESFKEEPQEETPAKPVEPEIDVSALADSKNYLHSDDDHYKTGIKTKFGVNHYRCHYICPNCSNRGNHYIKKDLRLVSCHDCQQQMVVKPASPNGFPETDEFTNFFVAGNFPLTT